MNAQEKDSRWLIMSDDNFSQDVSEAARALGRRTSERKKRSSAENGKKGGRPRSLITPEMLAERASAVIVLDAATAVINREWVVAVLQAEFEVSRTRCITAIAKAARKARWAMKVAGK